MNHEAGDGQDVTAAVHDFPGPLIPLELAKAVIEHHGPLRGRQSDPDSILRHLSRPGHPNGEGCRRIFLGCHPQDPSSSSSPGTGSRSFLIGVDTLWAEERALARQAEQVNRVQREGQLHAAASLDQRNGLSKQKHVSSLRRSRKGKQRAREGSEGSITTSDDTSTSSGSSSSEDDGSSTAQDRPKRHRKRRSARQNGDTRVDSLFAQLRSGDDRKKLSEGEPEHRSSRAASTDLSRRAVDSAAALSDETTSAYLSAQALLAPDGSRAFDKPVDPETVQKVRQEGPATDMEGPDLQLRHDLMRRPSETLVPETASDTVVVTRPRLDYQDGTVKSAIWDATRRRGQVPTQKKRVRVLAGPSGDQPVASPEKVLARPDRSVDPSVVALAEVPAFGHLGRSPSTESLRLLKRLAHTKQESLPPGVEKLERMLVRVGWTSREDLPEDFDELAARRFPIRYNRWEEMAVVWKRNRLELWGSYVRRKLGPRSLADVHYFFSSGRSLQAPFHSKASAEADRPAQSRYAAFAVHGCGRNHIPAVQTPASRRSTPVCKTGFKEQATLGAPGHFGLFASSEMPISRRRLVPWPAHCLRQRACLVSRDPLTGAGFQGPFACRCRSTRHFFVCECVSLGCTRANDGGSTSFKFSFQGRDACQLQSIACSPY